MSLIDLLNKRKKDIEDAGGDLEDTRKEFIKKQDDQNIGTLRGLKDMFKKKQPPKDEEK